LSTEVKWKDVVISAITIVAMITIVSLVSSPQVFEYDLYRRHHDIVNTVFTLVAALLMWCALRIRE